MVRPDARARRRGLLAGLEPPPRALLDAPLDYLFADHFRQRSLFALLREIAVSRRASREEAVAIAAFLAGDLALHHADEDEDLFPLVRKRAEPEDGLDPILQRLSADHTKSAELVETIATSLGRRHGRGAARIGPRGAAAMVAYAESEHRHLSIENSIVLVIARKRLQPRDLDAMSRAMKARRVRPTGE